MNRWEKIKKREKERKRRLQQLQVEVDSQIKWKQIFLLSFTVFSSLSAILLLSLHYTTPHHHKINFLRSKSVYSSLFSLSTIPSHNFWLGHKLGPISKRGPRAPRTPAGAGLGPGKKPGTLNGAGPGHGSCPAGRVRV